MNYLKIFHWEKSNFEIIGNFSHTTEFLTLEKAVLILLHLYLQMLIMQIPDQTGSYKYNKKVKTKRSALLGLKFNIFKTIIIRGNFFWKCPLVPWYPCSLT